MSRTALPEIGETMKTLRVISPGHSLDDDINIYNYADDNSLLCSGSDYENVKSKLLHNVNKVVAWFQGNHMKVNPDKF